MRARLSLVTMTLMITLAPSAGTAQGARSDTDTREVLAYRLTMPKLRQLDQVYAELNRLQEADPQYQLLMKKKRELAALEAKEELTDAEMERMAQLEEEIAALEAAEEEAEDVDPSLDGMVARMEAEPRVTGALKRVGLTAREAVVMSLALFQAGFAAELLASGTVTEIPKDVSAENVKFYQTHKAEIATLTALAEQAKD